MRNFSLFVTDYWHSLNLILFDNNDFKKVDTKVCLPTIKTIYAL